MLRVLFAGEKSYFQSFNIFQSILSTKIMNEYGWPSLSTGTVSMKSTMDQN